MPKASTPAVSKTHTFTMQQKAPKKGSVLFESSDPDTLLQAIYVMRRGASEYFDIKDLDVVKELEVTITVK